MLRTAAKEEEPLPPLSWVKLNTCQSTDLEKVLRICGWYRGKLGWDECHELLRDEPVGRWFLRDGTDNSDDNCRHFVVCLQTAQGVQFLPMADFQGTYSLAPSVQVHVDVSFYECPVAMLEYYYNYTKRLDGTSAKVAEAACAIKVELYLKEPLLKEAHALKHLARLTVNKHRGWLSRRMEGLPRVLEDYLEEYPYTI